MIGKAALAALRTRAETVDPSPYMDDVLRYALVRLGSREDAEDVAAQVYHAATRLRECEDLRLYLLGIARRKVADAMRRRRRTPRTRSLAEPGFEPGRGPDIESVHRRAAVADVLRQLSDEHREALALKYLVGLSAAEIADLTDRTPTAVNSLLQRAREAFAAAAGDRVAEDTL